MIRFFRFSVSGSFVVIASLFFSLSVCSDDFNMYLEEWEIKWGGQEVINIQVFPSEMLPAGINRVDLMILDDPSDGAELAVIGHGQDTLCFGTVPFGMFLNPAKTFAFFRSEDSLIIVSSEYPNSAARNNASYEWKADERSLIPVDSWESDWSADLLASADSLLEIGEIRQAADSIDMMLYGWAYFDPSELSCRFLRAAHAASKDADKEEALDYYDAAVYAFGILLYDDTWFISFESLEDFMRSDFAEYIEAEELADILHDYAEFFRDNDFAVEAIFDSTADILEGKD